jgi:hypothetical protein
MQPGDAVSWFNDSGMPTRVILNTPFEEAALEASGDETRVIAEEDNITTKARTPRIRMVLFKQYLRRRFRT